MTLLSVVKDVCATVGVTIPTSVFSNIAANRTAQEMLSVANEMAQRIAYDTRDWARLKKVNVFTGDNLTMAFDMPANYKRMLLSSNVWLSSSAIHPMRFVPDLDDWIQRRALNRFDPWGEWTLVGGQMLLFPAMGSGITATFAYLDKNCVALTSGGYGDLFLNDGDSFALDERILKLGMIWQWKAQKGSPYAEDMGTYEDAIAMVSGADSPAPILVGRAPISDLATASIAYPYPVPVP
jgi:hypothetical protein